MTRPSVPAAPAALCAALAAAAALAASGPTAAQGSAPPQGPSAKPSPGQVAPAAHAGGDRSLEQAPKRVPGYLSREQTVDAYLVLPPPPKPGSRDPGELLDRQGFDAAEALKGTARWALADRDADESPAAALADYDCVFGLAFTPADAPALLHMLTRVRSDAGSQTTRAKNRFQHLRPFVSYGGPICTGPDSDGIAHSWSYPSGHTTMIWADGLILTELAPDLATPILERTRAYGESRVVCGVHTVSDVTQGEVNGAMLTARLHADAAFKADLEAARIELAALRKAGGAVPAGRQCAVERDAMARTPWAVARDPDRAPADPPKTLPRPVARTP